MAGEWPWWTVVPPALLAFAVLFLAALGAIGATAMNCFDVCRSGGAGSVGAGIAAGSAGVPILAAAAVVLLVAGVTVPAWRAVVFAGLWAVFLLACGCAALVI